MCSFIFYIRINNLVVCCSDRGLRVQVGVLGLLPRLALHALGKQQVPLPHQLHQVHLVREAGSRACAQKKKLNGVGVGQWVSDKRKNNAHDVMVSIVDREGPTNTHHKKVCVCPLSPTCPEPAVKSLALHYSPV